MLLFDILTGTVYDYCVMDRIEYIVLSSEMFLTVFILAALRECFQYCGVLPQTPLGALKKMSVILQQTNFQIALYNDDHKMSYK